MKLSIENLQSIKYFCLHAIVLKHVTWLNVRQLKLGNIWEIFLSNCQCCKKHLNYNEHNSLHWLGHYLFFKGYSFPLQFSEKVAWENCKLWRTDNVRRQISEVVFAPNGGYCLNVTIIIHWSGGKYPPLSLKLGRIAGLVYTTQVK